MFLFLSIKTYSSGHIFGFIALLTFSLHYSLHISHECWHGLLFTSKKTNVIVGMFTSALIGLPFGFAKKIHFNHHRCLNEPEDPGYGYTRSDLSKKELLIKILGILFFLNHLKNIQPVLRKIVNSNGKAKAREDVTQRKSLDQTGLKVGDMLFVVILHLLIMGILIYFFDWKIFVLFEYAVLALLPFVDAIRTLIDHRRAIGVDSKGFTRNFKTNIIDKLLTKTYFDWHILHHQYPQIPQSNLKRVERLVVERLNGRPYYNSTASNSVTALSQALTLNRT